MLFPQIMAIHSGSNTISDNLKAQETKQKQTEPGGASNLARKTRKELPMLVVFSL